MTVNKNIDQLKEARKEALRVNTKFALKHTTRATVFTLITVLPFALGVATPSLLKKIPVNSYELVSVDNNGNEEYIGLQDDKSQNVFKVYTSCTESDKGYVKTYDVYSKKDMDSAVFEYIHNQEDLSKMLGTPDESGYEIDDVYIDLDENYATCTECRVSDVKTTKKKMSPMTYVATTYLGGILSCTFTKIAKYKDLYDKIDDLYGYVDSYDVKNANKKVKKLKLKKKEGDLIE